MGRTSPTLSSLCMNRVMSRVRSPSSPPVESSRSISSSTIEAIVADQATELPDNGQRHSDAGLKSETTPGRRIMIVVDSSPEAKGALQWVLSHTVQSHDILILLHVAKPSRQGAAENEKETIPTGYELLYSMKNTCFIRRPDVHVEITLVEGKEKGAAIVEEAKKQGVFLLVMGQRKRSVTWRLLMVWAGNKMKDGAIDYCIQNAECMTLAVRRKNRKLGGYLITSRRHKDFWLLA